MTDTADTHIHLRARQADKALIDRAAAAAGTSRSDFMMSSAVRQAKAVLLDRQRIELGAVDFNRVLKWLDGNPGAEERAGLKRLLAVRQDWANGA